MKFCEICCDWMSTGYTCQLCQRNVCEFHTEWGDDDLTYCINCDEKMQAVASTGSKLFNLLDQENSDV